MESTPDSTYKNQQPKNNGSRYRHPIAFLTHLNMYSVIITWQNINTRQTQYSLQQSTKAPNTLPHLDSKTPTMANELWNVDSLELPTSIVAANNLRPSNTTILSNEHTAMEITCVTRVAEFEQLFIYQVTKDTKRKSKKSKQA
jgi:hypothetical protein